MTLFTFGKYKGQPVDTIISQNPKYVQWAANNVAFFTLTEKQRNQLLLVLSRRVPNWPCSNFSGWAEDWATSEAFSEGAYGLD